MEAARSSLRNFASCFAIFAVLPGRICITANYATDFAKSAKERKNVAVLRRGIYFRFGLLDRLLDRTILDGWFKDTRKYFCVECRF
jgi:hypothetical protein